MLRYYIKYFVLYAFIVWLSLFIEVYVFMDPFFLHPKLYIMPVVMVALLAIFPAYLEYKLYNKNQEKIDIPLPKKTNFQPKKDRNDVLTGALRKDAFNEIFGMKILEAKHLQSPLSLIIFDIDHFKQINDTYGHLVGDTVLQELSHIIKDNIRSSEYFVRWGGEEFILLMPGTSLQNAAMVAEKLRRAIEAHDFDKVGKVTCSFGVTALNEKDTIKSFLERADAALYEAKNSGRNVVRVRR
ncbi:GGDEF domain-containing protein [Nitratiruptor sp. YY09-18]|uniref:GGDEF domain-containing protein n=1 Tax=Nitratiruptor sp. YY09-18 TaxID=2724901 RepID=UPI001915945E|nr:GGDEF domain-containing protein [Nitratiruptor sp. YY09-18]BCD67415.1 diguanylate cyclase [Nitratiruptor sp. YY09-18]